MNNIDTLNENLSFNAIHFNGGLIFTVAKNRFNNYVSVID